MTQDKIQLNGETIYLKKSFLGWTVINPVKNEDGTWNWYNFFTGGHLLKPVLVIALSLIIIFFALEYSKNMEICAKAIELANNLKIGGTIG